MPGGTLLDGTIKMNIGDLYDRIAATILDDLKAGNPAGIDRASMDHFRDATPRFSLKEVTTRLKASGLPDITYDMNGRGDWIVTSAPATPSVAEPEMDLTVPRDAWPEIIEKTTGHLLAYGPPGTGKSHTFSAVAAKLAAAKGKDYYEVSCTRQTSAAAWVGHWIESLVDKAGGGQERAFVWSDGPAALAMIEGVPLVVNDIHLCSDDLYDLMYLLMDGRPGLKLSLPGGRTLSPEPGYRILASMNGLPEQILDEPIRDRLQIKRFIKAPSKEQLQVLDADVRPLCKYVYDNAGPAGPKYTFREFLHFCKNRREVADPFWAASLTFEDEDRARAFIEPVLVGARKRAEKANAKTGD